MKLSDLLADYPDADVEIGAELEKVAALAQTYDRSGKVVVTLSVAKAGNKVQVNVGTKTTEPRPDPEIGLFHVGPEGLTKHDQYQTRIDPDTGELIEAPHARKD